MDALTTAPPWRAQCEVLYREHSPRLLRLCRLLLLNPQEAEDVAHEVFLKLVESHREIDRAMAWGPWLTRGRDQRVSRPTAEGVVAPLARYP